MVWLSRIPRRISRSLCRISRSRWRYQSNSSIGRSSIMIQIKNSGAFLGFEFAAPGSKYELQDLYSCLYVPISSIDLNSIFLSRKPFKRVTICYQNKKEDFSNGNFTNCARFLSALIAESLVLEGMISSFIGSGLPKLRPCPMCSHVQH